MALPASLPRNQAASTASACPISHGTASGRPENSTAITGWPSMRPRSMTACANARCCPGRSRQARLAASPLMLAASPRHRMIASAVAHTPSPCAMPRVSFPWISTPEACVISIPGSAARSPASTLTCAAGSPASDHGPAISAAASASGPITASRRIDPASGRAARSFFSSTMARAPTRRASARRWASDRGAFSGGPPTVRLVEQAQPLLQCAARGARPRRSPSCRRVRAPAPAADRSR